MAYDPPEKVTDWEMVGVEKDGEFFECGGEGGGVDVFTTGPWNPPD